MTFIANIVNCNGQGTVSKTTFNLYCSPDLKERMESLIQEHPEAWSMPSGKCYMYLFFCFFTVSSLLGLGFFAISPFEVIFPCFALCIFPAHK